jgi:hypothetical protein
VVVTINKLAEAEDGKAVAQLSYIDVLIALEKGKEEAEAAGQGSPIVINVDVSVAEDDIADISTEAPMPALAEVSKVQNASLLINYGEAGSIKLGNAAISSVAANNGENVTAGLAGNRARHSVNILVDGAPLHVVDGGINISLQSPAGSGVVVFREAGGGAADDTVVKKSLVDNGNAVALVPGAGTVRVLEGHTDFSDVPASSWYYGPAQFASGRELLMGDGSGSFMPNSPMTRGMLTTVIYRLEEGSPSETGAVSSFNDVPESEWFSLGVNWAANSGIVSGYGDGRFGPHDSLTREQLAVALFNYANHIGLATVERGDTTVFTDSRRISSWAGDAVRWAVGAGLLRGDDRSRLNPGSVASRAEVATTLMRLIGRLLK